MRQFLVFLLCVGLLVACAPTPTEVIFTDVPPVAAPTVTNAPESGIEGLVTMGPACPVARIDQPCPDAPFQATLTVLTPTGEQVTQFQTDENGQYHVTLAPGEYVLHPETANQIQRAAEVPFTVESGQFTTVDVSYDSGIR